MLQTDSNLTPKEPKLRKEWKLVGHIGVDAGLCWIGDPCYVLHKKEPYKAIGKDWPEFCRGLEGDRMYKSFNYDAGHEGLGVAVSTGYGDGFYPVHAYFNDEGRITRVQIDFNSDFDEEA